MVLAAVLSMALALSGAGAAAFAGSAFYYGDVNPGPMGKIAAPKVTAETTGRTSVQLRWKPVKGAKGYVVYRSQGLFGGDFKKVKTVKDGGASGCRDTKCRKNTDYRYEIFAFKYQNGKRVYSQTASVTANSGVVKPYIGVYPFSVEAMDIYVRSTGADRIDIYRSDTQDGPFSKIGEAKSEDFSWVDENVEFAGTYYYKARAYKKINGKTCSSPWSETKGNTVYDPHLDISVEDLNKADVKTKTFLYKLTSKAANAPATIYRDGESEDYGKFDYYYDGEKIIGGSCWTSWVKVDLDSYSTDGIHYEKMPESIPLAPGDSVWLRFQAEDAVTYYNSGTVSLDIEYGKYRVDAGAIRFSPDGTSYFSYDY